MSENLQNKMIRGTLWGAVERISIQGIQFVVMVVMARILTPEDYGLVGLLAIFISISQALIDSGFSQALIRKQDKSQIDKCTVFYFNIAVSVGLYLILFFLAPLVAEFYSYPILVPLMRVICISLVINSLVVVQRALLTEQIDFKSQAKATFCGGMVSGMIGVSMAYLGFGVWAIVFQQLSNYFTIMLLLWHYSNWRPSLMFSKSSFMELFSFGFKLALSGIINSIYNNLYLVVIGKFYKTAELGYYTRAQQFADLPAVTLTGILQKVTFPMLCKMQYNDELLRNSYMRLLRLASFVIFPIMCLLAGVAKPFVNVLLTEQWAFAGKLLTILCFAMIWYPLHAINLNLLQVKGRSDLFLRLEIYKKIIGVIIIAASIPFGIIVMCYGMILSSIISLIINTSYTRKLIDMGFWAQMKILLPTILYSFSEFLIVLLTANSISNKYIGLGVGVGIGIIYFISVTYFTKSKDLADLLHLVKTRGDG